jgi:L,D-transpeptidase YnhG
MVVFERSFLPAVLLAVLSLFWFADANGQRIDKATTTKSDGASSKLKEGLAEARLIEIYHLVGQGRNREALDKATALAQELPTFQLAQLVYGDLLNSRIRSVQTFGDVPTEMIQNASATLADLREESKRRMRALRERPPVGALPSNFQHLSPRSKHAIAIDASRSRLYLFENSLSGLKLVSDYYISVGKSGISKSIEGDQRTPLGVYYITSNLDPKSLKDFYGSGALPINYPNILDTRRGKTGSGIWLHGTPPEQFSRAPLASDGCIVLTNPDLSHIIRTVEVRTTPVVIASELKWMAPEALISESKAFEDTLNAWREAKSRGNMSLLLAFYAPDFNSYGKNLQQWIPAAQLEIAKVNGKNIQLKDMSYLRWTDSSDTMVVTFGEVAEGAKTGVTKRQYWTRSGTQWKIFFEGVI